MTNRNDVPLRWQTEETTVRARLAAPGVASPQDVKQSSGIAFLQRIFNGQLPSPPIEKRSGLFRLSSPDVSYFKVPLTSAIAIRLAACTAVTSARCSIRGRMRNPFDCSRLGPVTQRLEVNVNLIRSLSDKVGPERAEGKTIHVGSRVGIAEAIITDVDGKRYAHATTTCLIFPLP